MNTLKERILRDGHVLQGDILRVDSFLNHQIDVGLLREIGAEFSRRFFKRDITKILTVEASGIGVACITSQFFHCVPVVFAKKSQTANLSPDIYSAPVDSFTHKKTFDIRVSREYLKPSDRVLIIDDFLAVGSAVRGLISLCKAAGAQCEGVGIVIEKGWQGGGDKLRSEGYDVQSLAVIDSMNNGKIVFRDN